MHAGLTAGSVPLYWVQQPDGMEIKPEPRLLRSAPENALALARHVDALRSRHRSIHAVSLLAQKGKENVCHFTELLCALCGDVYVCVCVCVGCYVCVCACTIVS